MQHSEADMSRSDPSRPGAAPPAPPGYSYPPRINEDGNPRPPPPRLPPMSSLLSMNERLEPEPHNPYAARRLPDMKHPLWISDSEPNAPVHHIYHPSQPPTHSHTTQYQAEPVLISNHPQSALGYPPDQRAPQAPPRQIRRIVQRRFEGPKGETATELVSPISTSNPYSSSRPPSLSATSQSGSPFQSPLPLSPATSSQMQNSRSMPISGLLSDSPRSEFTIPSDCSLLTYLSPESSRPSPTYSIRMRQEPLAARACGFGERDRRVIDPPPILQMVVQDPNASPEELSALIRQPAAVVHCTLWDPVADKDDTAMPGTTDKRQQRRLMGTLVSSPFVGLDEHDVEGCFFTFPDLSVRTPGTYSLRFSLMILDPMRMSRGDKVPISSLVWSQSFHVYNAKDFSGMRASTELTKRLKHQGCLISVKKGNAKSTGGSHARDDDDEDDDDDDDNEDLVAKKPIKRAKR